MTWSKYTTVQSKKAVSAHITNQQILPSAFAPDCNSIYYRIVPFIRGILHIYKYMGVI